MAIWRNAVLKTKAPSIYKRSNSDVECAFRVFINLRREAEDSDEMVIEGNCLILVDMSYHRFLIERRERSVHFSKSFFYLWLEIIIALIGYII